MRYYKPKHYCTEEFVPPDLFEERGEDSILVMDVRILITMDLLWEYFNPLPLIKRRSITINTWKWGGQFSQRGFRNDLTIGAKLSAHRIGQACDFDIKGISAVEFRQMARAKKLEIPLALITRIENGVGWNHIDTMTIPGKDIVIFNA